MEKKIEELYAQLVTEFPDCHVTMGVGRNRYGTAAAWHIEIVGDEKDCPCCHQKVEGNFAVWSEPTFDEALAKIREMMKEKNHVS